MAAITVILLVSILGFSSARPNGAPVGACVSLTPAVGPHGAGSTAANPYTVTVEGLQSTGGRYFYQAGQTYNVTLRATTNGIQFQGFLVQLRSAADQSIIGEQLVENSDQIQQHACTPATGGFTHVSPSDKDYITFQWTPRAGTGDVVFRYTVVQTQPVHWDAATTQTLSEDVQRSCTNTTMVGQASVYWTVTNAILSFSLRTMAMDGYYAAVGFSMDRMMPNTDIVVGAVNQSYNFVNDRFATVRAMPPLDTIQNVMETSARIVDGQIEVNFTRLLNTGDTVQDFNLADNCFYLLVASGRVANFNTSMIMQHTFRASSSDQFCFCPPLSSPPSSSPPIPMPTSTPTPTPTGGAGMVASLSVWLLLMIAAIQYLL